MLLDQAKTKRNVKIVSIIAALAFVGGIVPILVKVIFFGGETTGITNVLPAAIERTKKEPKNAEAWDELAIAYRDQANNRAGDLPNATKAAQTALSLTQPASPARYDRVITLVQIYQRANKGKEALAVANRFTTVQPKNAEGFFTLGSVARDQGNTTLARLSFERYLTLAPNGDLASDVRTAIQNLNTLTAPVTPVTPATPATP